MTWLSVSASWSNSDYGGATRLCQPAGRAASEAVGKALQTHRQRAEKRDDRRYGAQSRRAGGQHAVRDASP